MIAPDGRKPWLILPHAGFTGKQRNFWERNLRFKTDVSKDGPEKNAPALVDAGMMGDRADLIFADPSEISGLIGNK